MILRLWRDDQREVKRKLSSLQSVVATLVRPGFFLPWWGCVHAYLSLASPKSRAWGKDLAAGDIFGRWSHKVRMRVWGEWAEKEKSIKGASWANHHCGQLRFNLVRDPLRHCVEYFPKPSHWRTEAGILIHPTLISQWLHLRGINSLHL